MKINSNYKLIPFLIWISIIYCLPLYSQSNQSEIHTEGVAKIKVTPDIALLTLKIEKIDTNEKRCLQSLNREMDKLTTMLSEIGFSPKVIKISDYGISSLLNDKRRKEYTAANSLTIEFKLDNNILDFFVKKMQSSEFSDLDISFETKLSNSLENETRKSLVQLALVDAKSKAAVIAKELGLKLGNIRKVSKYSPELESIADMDIVKVTPPNIVYDKEIQYYSLFNNFQVSQINLEEKITIIFEGIN